MKGLNENLCTHGADMLAYLYDEMPSAERERFELHLSDCGTCIDDFAELSQSRYPVYEWKQIEFDPMATPRVVIPYGEVAASWFDRLRAAFTFKPALAFGGVAAMLLAGVVTVYVLFTGAPAVDLAKEVAPSPSPVRTLPSPSSSDPAETTAGSDTAPSAKPKVVNTSMPAKTPGKPVRTKATSPTPKKNERLPVYSTSDDDEDDTLRLADIFAELDTSE